MSLDPISLRCPYCGEHFDTVVDIGAGEDQQYVEDCAVCCRPIDVRIALASGGEIMVHSRRDDDSA